MITIFVFRLWRWRTDPVITFRIAVRLKDWDLTSVYETSALTVIVTSTDEDVANLPDPFWFTYDNPFFPTSDFIILRRLRASRRPLSSEPAETTTDISTRRHVSISWVVMNALCDTEQTWLTVSANMDKSFPRPICRRTPEDRSTRETSLPSSLCRPMERRQSLPWHNNSTLRSGEEGSASCPSVNPISATLLSTSEGKSLLLDNEDFYVANDQFLPSTLQFNVHWSFARRSSHRFQRIRVHESVQSCVFATHYLTISATTC